MKTVKIETPFIKLDSLLKLADLVSSGGEAKMVIQDGFYEKSYAISSHHFNNVFAVRLLRQDGNRSNYGHYPARI